ncbi:MAG: preprotein translocase subunit SecA [Calditrichaeota bacterium]|nr:preprotein translocase subunit SecA [Calditrichota bacterium]
MLAKIVRKIYGSRHDRTVRKMYPLVKRIKELADSYQTLPEEEFLSHTDQFKKRIADGATLNEILPEAYATVKEAARRLMDTEFTVQGNRMIWDMIHYDVQIIGGIALAENSIAEMATGEGKTLVSTMPIYLHALTGKGVHVVTVNDYLAERDSQWMGYLFNYLGLSVGVILNNMRPSKRREMYQCDITYGTNNEFGFDYLRDNMCGDVSELVQRGHFFAIVDEVDSVLIDEARTPLIISGPVSHSTHQYDKLNPLVKRLVGRQRDHVNELITKAEELLKNDPNDYEACRLLLIAQRGAPKNKRLNRLLNDEGYLKKIQNVESDYLREKKIHQLDEEIYFTIEEKNNTVDMSDIGREYISPDDPEYFVLPEYGSVIADIETDESLSDIEKLEKKEAFQEEYSVKAERLHNIAQLLKAYMLFEKDDEYVVQNGQVQIVDEFTGRIMEGRRFSDGLHQAIEAKEGVKIERETQTMATITLQNYFRMYDKLAGMTGTAETESLEFFEIYKLDTLVIPTNRPIARNDLNDRIYRTKRERYNAVVDKITELHENGQPVLVGTTSVDESELISRMLKRTGIQHNVLNAKNNAHEAEIIANAGQKGAVTISTNMAGRGTDIKLGKDVKDVGLFVLGTGRHEARRIDRQLRGRSGRQGDPGTTEFYLSIEDDLLRLFGMDRIAGMMDRLKVEEGEVITHTLITRQIEKAQKRVEMQNFSIRKRLIEYDNVMNTQRTVIYDQRMAALKNESVHEMIMERLDTFIQNTIDNFSSGGKGLAGDWFLDEIYTKFSDVLLIDHDPVDEIREKTFEELTAHIKAKAEKILQMKIDLVSKERFEEFERYVVLSVTDSYWKDHLYEMDALRENSQMEAMGKQKDPLLIYKAGAYDMFIKLLDSMDEQILRLIWHVKVEMDPAQQRQVEQVYQTNHSSMNAFDGASQEMQQAAQSSRGNKTVVRDDPKVGRNDPCPCGSGKKYKQCHGKVTA